MEKMTEVKETKKTELREEGKEKSIESEESQTTIKRYFRPQVTICMNEENTGYSGQVILPGVDKEAISLRMSDSYMTIIGERDDIQYRRSYAFGCPIDPSTATATYKEGLLTFNVNLKEPEFSTVDIKVQ